MVSMRGPRDTYKIEVIPIVEEHIPSFRNCLDSVARERVYLGMTKAPPIDSTFEFVRSNIKNNYPQFVAVEENRVVGWCDIIPRLRLRLLGTLGLNALSLRFMHPIPGLLECMRNGVLFGRGSRNVLVSLMVSMMISS